MQYILNETEFQAFQNLKEENAKLSHKLAVASKVREMDRAQLKEIMRDIDGTVKVLANTRAEAKRLQELADERLVSMHNLSNEVRRLRAEHVCIAQNPRTGTVKVISVVKADTYRQHGWTVSEEFLVDRPA